MPSRLPQSSLPNVRQKMQSKKSGYLPPDLLPQPPIAYLVWLEVLHFAPVPEARLGWHTLLASQGRLILHWPHNHSQPWLSFLRTWILINSF